MFVYTIQDIIGLLILSLVIFIILTLKIGDWLKSIWSTK